jgi:hypothetical protein
MKTRQLLIGSLVACLLTVSGPAVAHHAWHGYDMANMTTVKGTVTQFDWGNPHVWISFEAKDDKAPAARVRATWPRPAGTKTHSSPEIRLPLSVTGSPMARIVCVS